MKKEQFSQNHSRRIPLLCVLFRLLILRHFRRTVNFGRSRERAKKIFRKLFLTNFQRDINCGFVTLGGKGNGT